jgi:hypothetical protein
MADLLTMEQAAKRLAISPKHLRQEFVNKGILPVVPLGSSCKGDRIRAEAIDALIESREVRRCPFTKEARFGGTSFKPEAKRFANPLGPPASARPRKSSAKLAAV